MTTLNISESLIKVQKVIFYISKKINKFTKSYNESFYCLVEKFYMKNVKLPFHVKYEKRTVFNNSVINISNKIKGRTAWVIIRIFAITFESTFLLSFKSEIGKLFLLVSKSRIFYKKLEIANSNDLQQSVFTCFNICYIKLKLLFV